MSLEIKDHPKLKGMVRSAHGDHAGETIVFATMSDGSAGLYKLYDVTGDRALRGCAHAWRATGCYGICACWRRGCVTTMWIPKRGEVMKEYSPFWPDKEEQDLYDVARPNNEGSLFLDMYEYTGNEEYKEAFITLCNSLVDKQGPEGLWMDFMPNDKESGSVHPRFNLWYAESLIDGYELTGDQSVPGSGH